jgi:hypothetical protein
LYTYLKRSPPTCSHNRTAWGWNLIDSHLLSQQLYLNTKCVEKTLSFVYPCSSLHCQDIHCNISGTNKKCCTQITIQWLQHDIILLSISFTLHAEEKMSRQPLHYSKVMNTLLQRAEQLLLQNSQAWNWVSIACMCLHFSMTYYAQIFVSSQKHDILHVEFK